MIFGHSRSATVSAPPVSDNSGLGNSWACTTPVTTASGAAFLCYASAAGSTSSAVTVTVSYPSGGRTEIARFTGLNATPEATAQGTVLSSASSISVPISTTHSGDLILASIAIDSGGACNCDPAYPLEHIADQDNDGGYASMIRGGAAGSYTATYNFLGTAQSRALQLVAFAPSSTSIPDSQMPDGGVSTAYKAQIHGIGGTAAFTCSISVGSLPTGLSLGGTGNCTISGTPSGSPGTTSFTAHIDDGAGHTASQALSIKIGATLNTPSVITSVAFHPLGTQGTINLEGVQCGDIIGLVTLGDYVFDLYGMLNTVTGTNNFWHGSLGETYTRYTSQPIAGTKNSPSPFILSTPVATSGTDTITYKTNFGSSHVGMATIIVVFRGVQGVVDPGIISYAGSPSQSSTSFTSLVPNTLEVVYANISNNGLPNATGVSLAAPFSQIDFWNGSQASQVQGYFLASTAGSTTATVTWSGAGGNSSRSIGMFGLRPSIVNGASCASFTGAGEKYRRVTW